MKGRRAGRGCILYSCFSREAWIKVLPNIPMVVFWTACNVLRGCITVWPFSEEDSWRAHGRDLVFSRAKCSPQRSHSMWAEAGRPRALPWYADFSLARRLCWARDAKQFGPTPALLQKCSPPASGRNMRCAPWLFPVPLVCSPHCKLDAGPATHAVTWIYQNEPDFKTSEATERNHPPASSDDRAKEYCSGPASFRFLTSNWNNTVPNRILPQCHMSIQRFSRLGKCLHLIKNILSKKKVLCKCIF